jgi:hypothetical protein
MHHVSTECSRALLGTRLPSSWQQWRMAANVTPVRSTPGAHGTPLRTPGSAGDASPDVSQLVQRLQVLRSRLSTMTATLEQSVAAASPLRGKADEEILYSTPKLVSQLLDGPIGQDVLLLLAPGAPAPAGTNVTEVRFTLSASSEEELEALVELLQLQDEQGVSKRSMSRSCGCNVGPRARVSV